MDGIGQSLPPTIERFSRDGPRGAVERKQAAGGFSEREAGKLMSAALAVDGKQREVVE